MADSKKPYGNVEYADPGYQEDGKARYPLDTEEHCRAAWSYINMEKNASKYSPEELSKIKAKIKAALKKYGVDVSDDNSSRSAGPLDYWRSWDLDDIQILRSGDGRTVEAYATPFDTPTYINDQHGEYEEVIARTAFNRTLSHGIERVNVFYHHGMTLHGTPSELGSVPIGRPIEIVPDGRGLRTVTRYNKSELADAVLESIRNGDIRGYSFNGQIYRSDPMRVPKRRPGDRLQRVVRTELGLKEYGPTPTPAYADAGILAIRSFLTLSPDVRARVANHAMSTPQDSDTQYATSQRELGAEDSHGVHSRRQRQIRLRAEALFRGM